LSFCILSPLLFFFSVLGIETPRASSFEVNILPLELCPSTIHFSEFAYVCFIYNNQSVSFSVRKHRKTASIYTFVEAEVQLAFKDPFSSRVKFKKLRWLCSVGFSVQRL
jgi:hypothetical protein